MLTCKGSRETDELERFFAGLGVLDSKMLQLWGCLDFQRSPRPLNRAPCVGFLKHLSSFPWGPAVFRRGHLGPLVPQSKPQTINTGSAHTSRPKKFLILPKCTVGSKQVLTERLKDSLIHTTTTTTIYLFIHLFIHWHVGVSCSLAVNDAAFSLLWLRSLLWCVFYPWPGNSHVMGVDKKKSHPLRLV